MVEKFFNQRTEDILNRFLEVLSPKCPYCSADVSYAYYDDYDGRYCPNCGKRI